MTLWHLVSEAGFADVFIANVASTFIAGLAIGFVLASWLALRKRARR